VSYAADIQAAAPFPAATDALCTRARRRCPACGRDFLPNPSRAAHRFCSAGCRARGRRNAEREAFLAWLERTCPQKDSEP